jgi:hypothetical protein
MVLVPCATLYSVTLFPILTCQASKTIFLATQLGFQGVPFSSALQHRHTSSGLDFVLYYKYFIEISLSAWVRGANILDVFVTHEVHKELYFRCTGTRPEFHH